MNPNIYNIRKTEWDFYKLTKKYDIYSLGVIFWQLTSRKTPFDFDSNNNINLMLDILGGKREEPIPDTNSKFVELYQSKYKT